MADTMQYKPIPGLNETSLNKIIEMSKKELAEKSYVDASVSSVTVNLATKSELGAKVDKEEGKGLSTEDFTTEYKNKLEGLNNVGVSDEQISAAVKKYLDDNPVSVDTSNLATKSEVNNKVDKVAGKGLSTNDYTTSEKTKLAGLSNYDDTEIKSKITRLQEDIANGVSQENINTAVNNYMQEHPISGGALTAEQEAKLNEIDNKVDKVSGKGLSTEDFTTEYKNKLEGLSNTGISDEQISTAVNNYMQEHPISSGATAEQAAQIESNKTAIADIINNKLDGKTFKFLTQAEYDVLSESEKNNETIEYHITDATENSHTHTNKKVLDKISEDADGSLLFDGNKITSNSTSGGITTVKYENLSTELQSVFVVIK